VLRGKNIAALIALQLALSLCLARPAESGLFDFDRVPGLVAGMVFVEGGCFVMGDRFGDGYPDERPTHEVCVDDFYFGKYEVTVGAFRQFVEDTDYRTTAERGGGCRALKGTDWVISSGATWKDPGFRQGYNSPVTCVSHEDAEAYARWKSKKLRRKYRLPTEAEWEYASRNKGRNFKYPWGNQEEPYGNIYDITAQRNLGPIAGLEEYRDGYIYTAPVAGHAPSPMGIHGLSGNLWEWTADFYGKKYYSKSPRTNPKGPESGKRKVIRGGSWYSKLSCLRTSKRSSLEGGGSYTIVGFRLVLATK
jgi:formylglycine-generating enzyme required for sulfatase activity